MKIIIPRQWQKITGGEEVNASGNTVGEVLKNLVSQFEELKSRLYVPFSPTNKINSFANVYLNDEDIRFLNAELTPVKDTDVLSIVPAMAGG